MQFHLNQMINRAYGNWNTFERHDYNGRTKSSKRNWFSDEQVHDRHRGLGIQHCKDEHILVSMPGIALNGVGEQNWVNRNPGLHSNRLQCLNGFYALWGSEVDNKIKIGGRSIIPMQ